MDRQEQIDAWTRARLEMALFRQKQQIRQNHLREAAIQSIIECRQAIWAADDLLDRQRGACLGAVRSFRL
jgi:hypothetical protein